MKTFVVLFLLKLASCADDAVGECRSYRNCLSMHEENVRALARGTIPSDLDVCATLTNATDCFSVAARTCDGYETFRNLLDAAIVKSHEYKTCPIHKAIGRDRVDENDPSPAGKCDRVRFLYCALTYIPLLKAIIRSNVTDTESFCETLKESLKCTTPEVFLCSESRSFMTLMTRVSEFVRMDRCVFGDPDFSVSSAPRFVFPTMVSTSLIIVSVVIFA